MKTSSMILAAGLLLLGTLGSPAMGQTSAPDGEGGNGTQQQQQQLTPAQRRARLVMMLGRALDKVHQHPDQIDATLDKFGQRMVDNGRDETDVSNRLEGVYAVFKTASTLDNASYQAQRADLVNQALKALRPKAGGRG